MKKDDGRGVFLVRFDFHILKDIGIYCLGFSHTSCVEQTLHTPCECGIARGQLLTGNKFAFGGRAKILDDCEVKSRWLVTRPEPPTGFPSASFYVFLAAP